jgi:hypothetical protein
MESRSLVKKSPPKLSSLSTPLLSYPQKTVSGGNQLSPSKFGKRQERSRKKKLYHCRPNEHLIIGDEKTETSVILTFIIERLILSRASPMVRRSRVGVVVYILAGH